MNKKVLFLCLPIAVYLSACGIGNAPNDVTLTTTPGICVSSVYPSYEVNPSIYYPYNSYPMNSYMPANSPYCTAVTITNNNAGQNSNNIQVYQNGLILSYSVESNSYSSNMIDYNASGLAQNNYSYNTVQQLGNIALFDPSNCVTTIGSKVNTISKGGGQCTFYLQIVNESMPVGNYPISVSVNYTNGNSNYFVSANIYQHVTLFAGGDFTEPSPYIATYQGTQNQAESVGYQLPISSPVRLLARDVAGNDYAYDGNNIFIFNGESVLQMQSTPLNILSLSADSVGNIFATTSNGLFVYNPLVSTNYQWSSVSGISGSVFAVQSFESANINTLYYTGLNSVESCVYANNSCSTPNQVFGGIGFNAGALTLNPYANQLVWGASGGVYDMSTTPLTISSGSFIESGIIGVDPLGYIYAANAHDALSAAVYNNNGNLSQLSPLLDSSNAQLLGVANGVHLRNYTVPSNSAITLYVYGYDMSTASYLSYLDMAVGSSLGSTYYAVGTWTGVSGFNGSINAAIVSSRFANN